MGEASLTFTLREGIFTYIVKVGTRLPIFRSSEQERLLGELFVFADGPISLSELSSRAGTSLGGTHKESDWLATETGEHALARFDRMRRHRNQSEYGSRAFGEAEVVGGIDSAQAISAACAKRI